MNKREKQQEKEGGGWEGGREREGEKLGRKTEEEGESKNEKGPNRWRQKLTKRIGGDQRQRQEGRQKKRGRGKLCILRMICCLLGGCHQRVADSPSSGNYPPPPAMPLQAERSPPPVPTRNQRRRYLVQVFLIQNRTINVF